MSNQSELEIIRAFYGRVCERAESNMLKTGRLEGAHFAAMKTELEILESSEITVAAGEIDNAVEIVQGYGLAQL